MDLVPFEKLESFLGKKRTVDVMGVASTVSPLTTTKRKSDNTEVGTEKRVKKHKHDGCRRCFRLVLNRLFIESVRCALTCTVCRLQVSRRDVTLADATGRSVAVTLWGESALNADIAEGQVVQVRPYGAPVCNWMPSCTISSTSVL